METSNIWQTSMDWVIVESERCWPCSGFVSAWGTYLVKVWILNIQLTLGSCILWTSNSMKHENDIQDDVCILFFNENTILSFVCWFLHFADANLIHLCVYLDNGKWCKDYVFATEHIMHIVSISLPSIHPFSLSSHLLNILMFIGNINFLNK